MNRRFRLLTVIVLVTAGILVMVYPAVSSYINTLHSSRAIQQFFDQIKTAGVDSLREQRRLAQAYNHSLSEGMALTDAEYDRILDFGNGIMGFIRLPAIGTELPIYHGVSDAVLQKGAGHLPGSALPIGGAGTHCILTGHTGLPGAELFTGLSELNEGDPFTLHVLDEVLVYAVDQIRVVLPHEVDDLVAADGHDYCTLVTCTPYGIIPTGFWYAANGCMTAKRPCFPQGLGLPMGTHRLPLPFRSLPPSPCRLLWVFWCCGKGGRIAHESHQKDLAPASRFPAAVPGPGIRSGAHGLHIHSDDL